MMGECVIWMSGNMIPTQMVSFTVPPDEILFEYVHDNEESVTESEKDE